MNWIIWSLISCFVTAIAFLMFQNANDLNVQEKTKYILSSLVCAGFFALMLLMLHKELTFSITKDTILLGLIFVIMNICLVISVNKGGSRAVQVNNMNIILVLIGGYIYFKERLTYKQIIGIVIALIGTSIMIQSN